MKISEIFMSIQGEGTESGLPTIIIRTAGCNLDCKWCDTKYASEGKEMPLSRILEKCNLYGIKRASITGGEPMIQEEIFDLIKELLKQKYNITIETNGSISLKKIPKKVRISMDIKCPSSGMENKMDYDNLEKIRKTDQIKFIIQNKKDYEFAKKIIKKYKLESKTNVIIQPEADSHFSKKIIDDLLRDRLNVRFGLQIHKIIWGDQKGR